jgi:hypothetical protein
VINKGRIIAAGQKSKIKVPKNATVVDETGKAAGTGFLRARFMGY